MFFFSDDLSLSYAHTQAVMQDNDKKAIVTVADEAQARALTRMNGKMYNGSKIYIKQVRSNRRDDSQPQAAPAASAPLNFDTLYAST